MNPNIEQNLKEAREIQAKRYQQSRSQQFESARSTTTNQEFFNTLQRLGELVLNFKKLPPAKTLNAFRDILDGNNDINELGSIEKLQKSLKSLQVSVGKAVVALSAALKAHSGVLIDLSLTKEYQQRVAEEVNSFNSQIKETLSLLGAYIKNVSEDYVKRYRRYTIINRRCHKLLRTLNTLKVLASTYQTQLAQLKSFDDKTALLEVEDVPPFQKPIKLLELAKPTILGSETLSKSTNSLRAPMRPSLPTELIFLVLDQLGDRGLARLSRVSKAHHQLVIGYRKHRFLLMPPDKCFGIIDHLSYAEVVNWLGITEEDPLSLVLEEYKQVSHKYQHCHFWETLLSDPTDHGLLLFIENNYGLRFESLISMRQFFNSCYLDDLLSDLINKYIPLALEIRSKFGAGNFSDLLKQNDALKLEELLRLLISLKERAALFERKMDEEILSFSNVSYFTKFCVNDAVKIHFKDDDSLLRNSPFARHLAFSSLMSVVRRRPDSSDNQFKILDIFIKPEYNHILVNFSENDLLEAVNTSVSQLVESVIKGIQQNNIVLFSKLNSKAVYFVANYNFLAARLILECEELLNKLSTEQIDKVKQSYSEYQSRMNSFAKKKETVINLRKEFEPLFADLNKLKALPLSQLLKYYITEAELWVESRNLSAYLNYHNSLDQETANNINGDLLCFDLQSDMLKDQVQIKMKKRVDEFKKISLQQVELFINRTNGTSFSLYDLNSEDFKKPLNEIQQFWMIYDNHYSEIKDYVSLFTLNYNITKFLFVNLDNSREIQDHCHAKISLLIEGLLDRIENEITLIENELKQYGDSSFSLSYQLKARLPSLESRLISILQSIAQVKKCIQLPYELNQAKRNPTMKKEIQSWFDIVSSNLNIMEENCTHFQSEIRNLRDRLVPESLKLSLRERIERQLKLFDDYKRAFDRLPESSLKYYYEQVLMSFHAIVSECAVEYNYDSDDEEKLTAIEQRIDLQNTYFVKFDFLLRDIFKVEDDLQDGHPVIKTARLRSASDIDVKSVDQQANKLINAVEIKGFHGLAVNIANFITKTLLAIGIPVAATGVGAYVGGVIGGILGLSTITFTGPAGFIGGASLGTWIGGAAGCTSGTVVGIYANSKVTFFSPVETRLTEFAKQSIDYVNGS